jgi:cytochrome c-type protein NapB
MSHAQSLKVAMTVTVGLAFVGFISGTSRSDYALAPPTPTETSAAMDADVPEARTWAEMRLTPRGEGSGFETDLAALAAAGPQILDEVSRAPGTIHSAVADRARLRAYEGAPPRIPHAVRQNSAAECLACHENGLRFRGRLAPPMSHTAMASCTQCHVVAESPIPGQAALVPDPRAVPSAFVGLAATPLGDRAWDIAPPQIPHRTFMRERCTSCHGVNGRDPMRSTHPHRGSCEQCHAPSAELDLRPGR